MFYKNDFRFETKNLIILIIIIFEQYRLQEGGSWFGYWWPDLLFWVFGILFPISRVSGALNIYL